MTVRKNIINSLLIAVGISIISFTILTSNRQAQAQQQIPTPIPLLNSPANTLTRTMTLDSQRFSLDESLGTLERPILSWPLRLAGSSKDYGYYVTGLYVDQDPVMDQLQDYNCGTRTYDGHNGTDISIGPFRWQKVDQEAVEVIAAAPGIIAYTRDGYFDRECVGFTGKPSNVVVIRHVDGSLTTYDHLRKDSVTPKTIGAFVDRGEYLGIVASSGFSGGPHLHFEVRDQADNVIDPYAGPCNNLNTDSWWDTQKPYYEPVILKLTTSEDKYQSPECPDTVDVTNFKNYFMPGDTIFFTAYYRDLLTDQQSQFTIYQPDNSIWKSWSATATKTNKFDFWWRYYPLSSNAPTGKWRFEVIFNGQTYDHQFFVTATEPVPALTLSQSSLDFGSLPVGSMSTPQIVTVQNTGNVTLTLDGLFLSADFKQTNDCFDNGYTLAIGASCTIAITFSPIGAGNRVKLLTLSSDASSNPDTIMLSGMGTGAVLDLSRTKLSTGRLRYPDVLIGNGWRRVITVENTGTLPLTLNSIDIDESDFVYLPDFNDPIRAPSCLLSPTTIAPNETCTIHVRLIPSSAGPITGTLFISSNSIYGLQQISLQGTGIQQVYLPLVIKD